MTNLTWNDVVECVYCESQWMRSKDDNESGWAISDYGIVDICTACYNHKEHRSINLDITLEKDYD